MRRPPYLGLAAAAGVILLLSVLVFRRYLPYVGSSLAPNQPPAIVLEMRNAYFVGLNHGDKIWSVKARKVEIGQDRYLTNLTGITQGKIFDSGKVALGIEAGHALYNSMAGDLILDRGIKLSGSGGQSLTAQGADWNPAASTLRSSGRVQYDSPWAKASTDRAVVDTKTRELTMWNVHASVDISKQEAGQHGL